MKLIWNAKVSLERKGTKMEFNRFDICEAWYLFLSETHEGQFSESYERLCKLRRIFTPKPNLDYDRLSPNGRDIYDNLYINGEY